MMLLSLPACTSLQCVSATVLRANESVSVSPCSVNKCNVIASCALHINVNDGDGSRGDLPHAYWGHHHHSSFMLCMAVYSCHAYALQSIQNIKCCLGQPCGYCVGGGCQCQHVDSYTTAHQAQSNRQDAATTANQT